MLRLCDIPPKFKGLIERCIQELEKSREDGTWEQVKIKTLVHTISLKSTRLTNVLLEKVDVFKEELADIVNYCMFVWNRLEQEVS